ncbi:E3 ubiquitin-protein ligase rnf14 [Chamberlinius hualienensis]
MPYTGAKPKYSNQGYREDVWRNSNQNQEKRNSSGQEGRYRKTPIEESENPNSRPNEKRNFNSSKQQHVKETPNQEQRLHKKENSEYEQCSHQKVSEKREPHHSGSARYEQHQENDDGGHDRRTRFRRTRYFEEQQETKRETQDQDDELLALASIYDSEVFHAEEGAYKGHFCAHMELPKPFFIKGFIPSPKAENSDTEDGSCVDFLPPIILQFRFPPNYPSEQMPYFLLRSSWLNNEQLSRLCKCLDKVWSENKHEVILFRWIEFFKEEALSVLNIKDTLDLSWIFSEGQQHEEKVLRETDKSYCDTSECGSNMSTTSQGYCASNFKRNSRFRMNPVGDRRAISEYSNSATIVSSLLEYNQMQKEKLFAMSVHFCNVCLEEKSGTLCVRFKDCGHVCCKECVKTYFEVQIVEGKVTGLTCPYEKCSTQASQALIRDLVDEELFSKYDRLLLSTTLDSMTDIQYCPRTFCQCAVVIEPSCTLGTCPSCFFAFCIFCRASYHGVEPCKMKSEERRKLYERYKNGSEEEKMVLDSRYGRLQMRHLVDLTLSESWVDEHSKQCPHCRSNIEKIDGCNKMSCWKCGKFFCWTCMAKLPNVEPYKHYEDPFATCYNRLFTGAFAEADEDFEDDLDDNSDSEDDE